MVGAILIQFRDFREGYLLPIQILEGIKSTGKKSINIEEARAMGMPLNLIYKRTRCYIDEYKFQHDFINFEI
jgi:penicillin-binding protein-related factor A (putative recombinase)